MKKIFSCILTLALVVCFIGTDFISPDKAFASATIGDQPEVFEPEEYSDRSVYLMGKEVPVKKTYQDMIDYYLIKDGYKYKGKNQCFGYAEMMRKRFGSGSGKRVNVNKKATKKVIYNTLKDVKPGTHARFKYEGSKMEHSYCIFKVTKDYVYCSEGNADGGGNGIAWGAYPTDSFTGLHLEYYIEPTGSIRKSSTTIKYDSADLKNRVTLLWEPIKNASKYTVYRSYRKSGGYKKIATTTHPRYVDKTAKYGVVYYKIKAGNYKTKAVKVYHKLLSKKVTVTHDARGYAVLKWPKVTGASKYKIYRAKYVYGGEPKLTLLKTVKGTSYTYKYTGSWDKDLLVRAVYSKNSKCNSFGTYVYSPIRVAPKAKIVSVKKTNESVPEGYISVRIGVRTPYLNKKTDSLYIDIYESTTKNGDYFNLGYVTVYDSVKTKEQYTSGKVYYFDTILNEADTYYFRAAAYNSAGYGTASDVYKWTI